MKMFITILVVYFSISVFAQNAVTYKHDDTELEGYLAVPVEKKANYPVVLIVHQWVGLGGYEKGRADQLAGMGYLAFAVDIYGKGVRAKDSAEAGKLATIYRSDRKLMRDRINAALDFIKKDSRADGKRIAAIGYCFGGGVVLELARSGAELNGVVSFHGSLNTPDITDAKAIRCKVLVCHGADDPLVSAEELATFKKEMRDAAVDWQLISYGGAVHAFTDKKHEGAPKGSPVAYNAKADKRSWEHMKLFFGELFE